MRKFSSEHKAILDNIKMLSKLGISIEEANKGFIGLIGDSGMKEGNEGNWWLAI